MEFVIIVIVAVAVVVGVIVFRSCYAYTRCLCVMALLSVALLRIAFLSFPCCQRCC